MLNVDLHTHTIASGHAMNTAYEMIQAAKSKGLELIALTDHGPKTNGGPTDSYFFILTQLPRRLFDLDVLVGCEANIIDCEGNIDLPERHLKMLDIILAGLHREAGWTQMSKEKNTEAIIAAMKNPYVNIISHPYGGANEVDMDRLVKASQEYCVPLEVNCLHLGYYERRGADVKDVRNMISLVRENHWKLVISSDAHIASMIGDDSVIDRLDLRRLLSKEIILNSSQQDVRKLLEEKRKTHPS
ncbi:MAG: putative hydrolase [Thermoproteota archaeon]|nr:putative hydrolase [Thermoproteota archaeon]